MKRLILTSVPTLILALFLSGLAFAQPGMDNPKGDRCINQTGPYQRPGDQN
jgi:hypothetical protein